MLELTIYAVIAFFILFRLYNSFGRVSAKHSTNNAIKESINVERNAVEDISKYLNDNAQEIENSLNVLKKIDKNFRLTDFMRGAERSFEIILKAYDRKDLQTIRNLVDESLHSKLIQKINSNTQEDQYTENTIIALKSIKICKLEIVDQIIYAVVHFVSEQINLIKNSQGKIIVGDKEVTNIVEDTWRFKKPIQASSPKWLLVSFSEE